MATKKQVYFFGAGKAEGKSDMKNLLGGKGANLAEMTSIGVPVPAGFTITTEVCIDYQAKKKWPVGLKTAVQDGLKKVEKAMGAKYGDKKRPLLVSVRSGARVSMPGMMDTVLNIGLNDETVQGLIADSGDERFAYDSYRRFVQMYGDVVMGVEHHDFEALLDKAKAKKGVENDTDLDAHDLKVLVKDFKELVKKTTGKTFPENPWDQLEGAINAVFSSWNNKRAFAYRNMNGIPHDWGTAVNVQSMVYGNLGDDSGTGVAFTRDPSTGEKVFFGEYLIKAQGEDVVAGIRTPQPINKAAKKAMSSSLPCLEEEMPKIYKELEGIYKKLEKHYRDMQDIEFTIQRGKLYLLQTRTGKRTGQASVRMAAEMVKEKLIDKKTAVSRVSPEQLDQLLHPMIDPKAKFDVMAKGLPASPGAVSGQVVFSADDAVAWKENGKKTILVRLETSPEDIHGMEAAEGILTARGGMTSHAAVVARGMGKTCVAGCGDIKVDYAKKQFSAGAVTIKEGDYVTIDGTSGRVIPGQVPTVDAQLDKNYDAIMSWADGIRKLQVWTNADTPEDAKKAREFGAQGIGLCRTEHMFFGEDRLPIMKEMVANLKSEEVRKACLAKLKPMQKKDFRGILEAMQGLPVTIRLLDPPLHEFLPPQLDLAVELATLKAKGKGEERVKELEELLDKVESLHEFNPMLGHRGCRLGITFPEIYDMQVEAIMEAACELKAKGVNVKPEIMIPLAGHWKELAFCRDRAELICKRILQEKKIRLTYHIGTMIEVPRAAVTADQVAKVADFFSFGTNDLTQMGCGFSRDDAGKFLPEYVEKGIYDRDPFQALDQEGVGRLVKMCVDMGRDYNPNLKIGICGEHGGEPSSVKFLHGVGLNYVSCSPYRVPIARLAAAHAVIEEEACCCSCTKKATAKKATAKKAPAKKATAKKAPAKKATAKKAPAKKATAKKAPAKKATAKKAPAKKATAKKAPAKKATAKKAPAKKATAKKAPAKKTRKR